jgi:hypothetical protein
LHVPTVIAISLVAYGLQNVIHEGLGHGGAGWLLGVKPVMLNAIFYDYDQATASVASQKWIASAGSIANLLFAGLFLVWSRLLSRSSSASLRYFLWLSAAVNLLDAFGYLLFSGLGGIGDWEKVVQGLEPHLLWRLGLAASGGVLYFVVAPRLLMPGLSEFVSADDSRLSRTKVLTLFPYLAGGALYVTAGLLNPQGLQLVLISAAAASFGGTSLLAWYPAQAAGKGTLGTATPFGIGKSPIWWMLAAVTVVVFVGVLGRGIRLS